HQNRLEDLIRKIQQDSVKEELRDWVNSEEQDLFEGIVILSRFHFPNIHKQDISNKIDKIKLDAWLEMHYDLTALEKVRILNHIFYEVNGFKGNTEDYHSPSNSFIHSVIDQHQGNPISLAILYSIVAQRLGIPVFGVNLPQHFILAYLFDEKLDETTLPDRNRMIKNGELSKVMFYINPFNKGLVFTRQNIDEFVRQLKIESMPEFYLPCNNVEILKRVIRNLVNSYSKQGNPSKVLGLADLMEILGGEVPGTAPDDQE
ncbi:MAG: transglutaminase-like domain-containing protein, partial [Bacteroidota bacterium]|nr:transglutaminase-like domain-containing protein [Bacteroidota bacterium]MDX5431818.1 transglutaminase-like domain-containing protein [Bacteroidota bacterium]MDX5470531.1 transglutaminase-like domain-containing protein [Bacteroidota bacterium]